MRGGGSGRHRRPRLGLPAHSPHGAAVYCFLCTFDKWLHFYILIANRNNTSEALERPQVPAQTGDERVSNERERQFTRNQTQGMFGRSIRMWGSKESLFMKTGDRAPQGLESRRNNCILRGQVKGQGFKEGISQVGNKSF